MIEPHPNLEALPWVEENEGYMFFSQEGPGYFFIAFMCEPGDEMRLTELLTQNGCKGGGIYYGNSESTVVGLIGSHAEIMNTDATRIAKLCNAAAKQIHSHLIALDEYDEDDDE